MDIRILNLALYDVTNIQATQDTLILEGRSKQAFVTIDKGSKTAMTNIINELSKGLQEENATIHLHELAEDYGFEYTFSIIVEKITLALHQRGLMGTEIMATTVQVENKNELTDIHLVYEHMDIAVNQVTLKFLTVDIESVDLQDSTKHTYITYDELSGDYELVSDGLVYTPILITEEKV